MAAEVHKREYNVSDSVKFKLYNPAGTAGLTGVTWAAGDVKISKDGGAFANATNNPTAIAEGWYTITFTAAELSAKQIIVQIEDAEGTWLETGFIIETYASASSQFPDNNNAIADAVLIRDLDQVEVAAPVHSLASAALKQVSRVVIDDTANTVTVYRTDGSTAKYTQAITQTASINPIIEQGIAT